MIGLCQAIIQVVVVWLDWPALAGLVAQLVGLGSLDC